MTEAASGYRTFLFSDRQLGPIDGKMSIVVPIVASNSYLVDPASSHMLVSKIKPCMSKYKPH